VFAFRQSALTELWSEAIAIHDQRPLTSSAALAAAAVGREDRRRRRLGIPSIFDAEAVVAPLPLGCVP
jgi:hypothetical protein